MSVINHPTHCPTAAYFFLVPAFILSSFITAKAQLPTYVPDSGLLVYYPFNGNVNDESGNGNHGTNFGATLTTDRVGIADKAYSTSASNSKIGFFYGHTLIPRTRTISFWFKSTPTGAVQKILNYRPTCAGGAERFFEFYLEPTNLTMVYIQGASGTMGASYVDKAWNHVALAVSNDSAFLYVNDTYQGFLSNIQHLSQQGTFAVSSIGCLPQNVRFTGSADEIGVWDRPLTRAEISELAKPCHMTVNNHPSDTTLYSGDDGIFISGSADSISYQWQSNSDSTGWVDISSTAKYSGITKDTLTVNNVDLRNHLQRFRMIASVGACRDTSNIALMQIADTCLFIHTDTIAYYDTTIVNDTLVINDTLVFNDTVVVMDTTFISVTDTTFISDTTFININDTTFLVIRDTITVSDTVLVMLYDTSYISVTDTLIIHAILTGLNPPNNRNTIRVYPNPATTHIYIDNGNLQLIGGYTIDIKNALGQSVFNKQINQQQFYIDLSGWTGKGIYFIYILDQQNNKVEMRKIILQ